MSKVSLGTSRTHRSKATTLKLEGSKKQLAINESLRQSIEHKKTSARLPATPKAKVEDGVVETIQPDDEVKSQKDSDEGKEEDPDAKAYQAVITKYDAESAITFNTDATSALTSHPLSISNALTSSSKLELQLMYLAKELETEKTRREQL